MNNLPIFFNYEEEGPTDKGYEAIQDFFLSWTLRCSNDTYKIDNFLINFYSKRILYSLLYGRNTESTLTVDFSHFESFKVLDVKTKRQLYGIDLLAHIKTRVDDTIENYILNIENKWYTTLGENQLNKYVQKIRENFDLNESKLINVVIFCDETILTRDLSQIEKCLKYQYKFTNIVELATLAQIDDLGATGNHLFDEYWVNF
jgi:hypothetical protein